MKILVATVLNAFLVATAHAQEPGDPAKGLAYAQLHCADCHAIRPSERFSPRLGLATFKAIADTPGMTGTALAVWLRTPHNAMPNLIIEAEDRSNLIAYIVSLREPRTQK